MTLDNHPSNPDSKANESIPTYGFVPLSFPRDPALVNQFLEHVVLGQLISPLVEADLSGNTKPGIAESWAFEDDGLRIRFSLRPDFRFADGSEITADDVSATLSRHLGTGTQSSNFLKAVSKIEVEGKSALTLFLKEKSVSILKALSRDQLGILPANWVYGRDPNEPIASSGLYRLVRKGSNWHLVANEHHRDRSTVTIPEWKLIFYKNDKLEMPEDVVPDFAAILNRKQGHTLSQFPSFKNGSHYSRKRMSFIQTSAWWHPHGENFNSLKHRERVMSVIDSLMEARVKEGALERSTGVIPLGVGGHLETPLQLPAEWQKGHDEVIRVRVASLGTEFDQVFEMPAAKDLLARAKVEVEIIRYSFLDVGTLKDLKPDVVLASWAGGFNDPDGFLPILNVFLAMDIVDYFSELAPLYLSARSEQNWPKRAELFRELNYHLVATRKMVPGWRVDITSSYSEWLKEDDSELRYTPRLASLRRRPHGVSGP